MTADALDEIIDPGKTGFIVDNEDEAVSAILNLHQIDRRTVRGALEERFTADVMARNYLRLYWRLCGTAGGRRWRSPNGEIAKAARA